MIALKYIDKPAATIAALRDYTCMQEIIKITPQEIKDISINMISHRTSVITDMPKTKNLKGGEDKLVSLLDEVDVLQERYRGAIEYMGWFEPAWSSLFDNERIILKEYYMGENQRSGATVRLQHELVYSDRQVERLRSKALSRLSLMLFGK